MQFLSQDDDAGGPEAARSQTKGRGPVEAPAVLGNVSEVMISVTADVRQKCTAGLVLDVLFAF